MSMNTKLGNLVRVLEDNDIEAYVVGGAVRSKLLEAPIKDIDIATPLSPAELLSLLPDEAKLIDSAQAYPVISFLGFEIASFRSDGKNRGDAQGIKLHATMKEDAMRRDFTMNALYVKLDWNNIDFFTNSEWESDFQHYVIDPTEQGLHDINNHLIRLIGNPEERLIEDPLRALRAYRFATQLPWGFSLEEKTKIAVDSVLKNVRMKV